jgi:hypothetical protein
MQLYLTTRQKAKVGRGPHRIVVTFLQGILYQYPLLDGPNLNTNGFAGGRESGGGEEVTEHFQGDHVTFCGACEGRRESTEAA